MSALAAEDRQRGEFLHRLDQSDLNVTDFEAQFTESFLTTPHAPNFWTRRRREVCDEMMKRYAARLVGTDETAVRRQLDLHSEPGHCGYLIRLDGRMQVCGDKAVWMSPSGLQLCRSHKENWDLEMERRRQRGLARKR